MELYLSKDMFSNIIPPSIWLCQTDKKIIGELHAYEISGTFKWNAYSEISFKVNRYYTDVLTGENKTNLMFDLLECPRLVKIGDTYGYFQIQDVDTTYSDRDEKTVTGFSFEYTTSMKFIDQLAINTGEDWSQEVIYHASRNGNDYWQNQDGFYKLAGATFDPYLRYYYKNFSDLDSYVYEEVQIADATEFATYDGSTVLKTLYIKSFENVQFYNPTTPELSLIHILMQFIPEWSIGSVDYSLWKQERRFTFDRTSVYDGFMSNVSEAFKCQVVWNTINNTVSFYEMPDDGLTEDEEVDARYATDIYISRENLASQIDIKVSSDNIKTKLKVTGGEDLDIRDVNLGQNYIMNLNYFHDPTWMGQDLYSKYAEYQELLEENTPLYTEAMQSWIGAYNIWNDLVNAVPVGGNVLLVGDEFEQLYCTYVPINNDVNTAVNSLTKWLDIYHVDEDTNANKKDNVLLTLKDPSENTATIRVYYSTLEALYKVRRSVKNATTGISAVVEYTPTQWVSGILTASYMGVSDYKITSIGTLGAYLCLTNDETQTENLQDYGIRLLEEKQKTYMLIFQTQTEELLANEQYQCVVSATLPEGEIPNGTRWLDTDASPLRVYIRNSSSTDGEYVGWDLTDVEQDMPRYEDYARYIENYNKLQAVQEVLIEKQRQAELRLNGVQIEGIYLDEEHRTEFYLRQAAQQYFGLTPVLVSYDDDAKTYEFTITGDENNYIVYLNGNVPYVAYATSQGANLAIMNYLKSETDMSTFFTEGEWMRLSAFIREDEFSDDNVFLTGYESEEERLSLCNELLTLATKELKTLSQPSLEFSMTLANILALPEFEPIKEQFKLGNYIKIELRPGLVKRARLLECNINFDDLSDFSCTFGNLITTQDPIDLHAQLLENAISAGRQVAKSASNWQKAVDRSDKISKEIENGLKNSVLEVGSNGNQSIKWDEHGILLRKKIDGTENSYEAEQILLTNNKIIATNSNFESATGVFGSYEYKGDTHYGLIAQSIRGGSIESSEIIGGSLRIGTGDTFFQVNEDGSVAIMSNGQEAYAGADVVAQIEQARQYHLSIVYSGSTVFSEPNQSTVLTCHIYSWDDDITNDVLSGATFAWKRNSRNSANDILWNNNPTHTISNNNTITITNADIDQNAQFYCEVTFTEP